MGRTSNARERLMAAVAELIWTGSYGDTTVDQICERARVQKGSFYHFFDSKAELAGTAIEREWEEERVHWDRIFSASSPPLLRLRRFCAYHLERQLELKRKYGHTLGCPLACLGTEVSTRVDALRRTVERIMKEAQAYFESLARDAQAGGAIRAADAATQARLLYAYGEGLLSQARIRDDPRVLREMEAGMRAILGLAEARPRPHARAGARKAVRNS